jgi:DNA-binding response OmpR family regulator
MPPREPAGRSGVGAQSALEHLDNNKQQDAAEQLRLRRAGHTILVVDDHPPMLYATAKALRIAGFQVVEADTGSEAVRLASEVSAVVLDVNLPDVNGIEAMQRIRRNAGVRTPVILTSAVYVDELHRDVGLNAGADAYLVAPLSHVTLLETLDQLL